MATGELEVAGEGYNTPAKLRKDYAHIVGKLGYLVTQTRTDLSCQGTQGTQVM